MTSCPLTIVFCGVLAAAGTATGLRNQQPALPSPGPVDAVLQAVDAHADPAMLLRWARSNDPTVQTIAIRALGNRHDRALTRPLMPFVASPTPAVRDEAVAALVQSLKGDPLPADPNQVSAVERLLIGSGSPLAAAALGRLPYTTAADVKTAERFMADPSRTIAAGGLEALARLHPRLADFDPETVETLAAVVAREQPGSPFDALGALIAARALDPASEKAALSAAPSTTIDDEAAAEIRRLALTALSGGAVALGPDDQFEEISRLLHDSWYTVRYEAVRAYARREAASHGCGPLVHALTDDSVHVALAAIDALGQACRGEDSVTDIVVAEARTPPPGGPWQREAHALVALARRDPARAAISMPAFRAHLLWQVRMYAAAAAGVIKDAPTLTRLASDRSDNVVNAALPLLQALDPDAAAPLIVAALRRQDCQLLRTTARLLKDVPPASALVPPLVDALRRLTTEGKDTSRDARLALIEAIRRHARRDTADDLTPWLRDFDPAVADAAAAAIGQLTGRTVHASPVTRPRPPLGPAFAGRAIVRMKSGASFVLRLRGEEAPLATRRFVQLVQQHYYDGLTFHRVVSNFVIQGGSPGANEYSGAHDFMLDERRLDSNERGTVGVSTRGADTGDGQFFVNLVTNRRLDGDYTIFATVSRHPSDGMAAVDGIVEGDEIERIDLLSQSPKPKA
ncbi:MAG TPA: peptidylprolyl isomerase [Vicinamibacterales bacterium]|nr:peptidylprolyl isomerase [Vicinamibacterales bacterium]